VPKTVFTFIVAESDN